MCIRDRPGPAEDERPTAYIIILNDTRIAKNSQYDQGIAAQAILLGAAEQGLGGCMLGSVDRGQMTALFNLSDHLQIGLVLALGKPDEIILIEDTPSTGSIEYYRDKADIHHVPKRTLNEIIITPKT